MLAVVEQTANGYTARYERHHKHSVEQVWAWLTENDKLVQWFSELRVEDLREGGMIKFDMQDGTFEELTILELKLNSVLEYSWGEDQVRFELYPEDNGCQLVLIEKITQITDHTPKDFAGWHVCLEAIRALLDGETLESRKDEWSIWHEKYAKLVENLPRG